MKNKMANKLLAILLSAAMAVTVLPQTNAFATEAGESEIAVEEIAVTDLSEQTGEDSADVEGETEEDAEIEAECETTGDGLEYYVREGDGTKTILISRYSGTATKLTIPSSINEIPVTCIGQNAFEDCSNLISITIPESVTSIDAYAFKGCSGLTSISVAKENAVYDSRENCNAIIEKETNTLIKGCINTTIPTSVMCIEKYAFEGCSDLSSITIPESVTSIGDSAFEGCSSLTGITIPKNVTKLGWGVFSGCSGLTSISVAKENAVYDSRENCNAIIETETNTLKTGCKNTTIPKGVTSIEYDAFFGCSGLTSITLPEGVASIDNYAFGYCSGLTGITISEGLKSIGEGAFIGCTSLASIIIPKSVTNIEFQAFYNCNALKDIYYTGSKEQWNSIIISNTLNDSLENATIHFNFTMPSQPEEPSDSDLSKQAAASSVALIKAIGTVTLDSKVAIDKARASYNALSEDAKKYVSAGDLELLINAEVKYTQLVADKAAAEKAAEEAAKKAAAEEAAKKAAAEAAKKEAVGAENVVGDATYVVAENQTVIYKAPVKKDVTSVKIPETIKINDKDFTVTEIAAGAFKNNKKLTKVTISKNIKIIGKNAFYGCSALKAVSIGSKVTTIGDGAFQGCSKLTKVTIPAKVTKIGKKAFYNCKKLKTITIKTSSLKSVGKSAFKKIAKKASIKVPKKKLTVYKKLLKGKTEADTKIKK